jgi:uncharacterized protein (TIGR02996 family)
MSALPDEQAALLAAVVADPDADAPRLVYADWLQEHDDEEQAQFIRAGVGIEWLTTFEDEKRQRVTRRLDDTAVRHGVRWLEALGVRPADLVYERGMVEGVVYDSYEAFRADAPLLFARVPVRDVTIDRLDGYDPLRELGATPELERLLGLHLANDGWAVTTRAWTAFVTSPHLARLQVLSVRDAGLIDDDARVLARCEQFGDLEELGLSGNRLTTAGALAVAQSPQFPKLRRLGLASNPIHEDRKRGSPYLELRDALIDRFDSAAALTAVV